MPTKAEMLRIVEPEQVVLSEAMTVGSQHLMDAGYGKADIADEKDDDDGNKMSVEQQLAPWMTTKSFVSAASKGTLMKLHGDGDPTGRGEAFSFIRASAKTPFVKAGEDLKVKEGERFIIIPSAVFLLTASTCSRNCGQDLSQVHCRGPSASISAGS